VSYAAAQSRIAIVLLAAVAENGVIGRDNALPWRLSTDLKRFKALTMGKPMVMGRKTYTSIGRPLPGRTNIVVTRDPNFHADGVVVAASVPMALELACAEARRTGADAVMVIGGTEIFRQTMTLADRLEITHVHARPEGDVIFPDIDPKHWRETARREHPAGPQDDASVSFVTYQRI